MSDMQDVFEKVATRLSDCKVTLNMRDCLPRSTAVGRMLRTGEASAIIEMKTGEPIDGQLNTILHESAHAFHELDRYKIIPETEWIKAAGSDEIRNDEQLKKYYESPAEKLARIQAEVWERKVQFIEDRYGDQERSEVVFKKCVALLVLPLDELIHYTNSDSKVK